MSGVAGPPLRFGADGLLPAVAQDADSGAVLMVAFVNAEALARTRETGRAHYWSRSRNRLWRKGESSGHEQVVEEIRINCEANSLLFLVRQIGAVCHDGYPTCFYRRLDPDDGLSVVAERAFDPALVYGRREPAPTEAQTAAAAVDDDPLAEGTRLLYGALRYLREHDLTGLSRTSVRLRRTTDTVTPRIVEELRELAGVLDGTHRHGELRDDVLLEGTQVLYWLLVATARAEVDWDRLRPDRALATGTDGLDHETAARLLAAEAKGWERGVAAGEDLGARCHATLALVAQACRVVGLTGLDLVGKDLAEMRSRPYLADYFAQADGNRAESDGE